MSLINMAKREINCKIVYYGIGLCGKTTNLHYIHQAVNPRDVGDMVSIDTETEQFIQQAIARVMRNRTSVIVAHRLSTIQRADNIIVLHHGEIREQGSHQDLLSLRGLYWKLYKLQYSDPSRATPMPEQEEEEQPLYRPPAPTLQFSE